MRHETRHEWSQPYKRQVALQDHDGTTKRAIEVLRRNRSKLQTLAYVELIMPRGRDWAETETRFIDTQGNYIQVDGLSWGYAGEGPHGLLTAFEMFKLPFEMELIASWDFEHAVIDAQNLLVHTCHCTGESTQTYTVLVNNEEKLSNKTYDKAWDEYARWVFWAIDRANGAHVEMIRDTDHVSVHRSWSEE